MPDYTTIPSSEQTNVTAIYWAMMRQLEEDALDSGNRLDRHLVESAYAVWNRSTGSDQQPSWNRPKLDNKSHL